MHADARCRALEYYAIDSLLQLERMQARSWHRNWHMYHSLVSSGTSWYCTDTSTSGNSRGLEY
jgi:hypothetical protein